ncbi:hypothetical protein RM863_21980 [Streptomyces sp. DSM 41014]|uniref:Uncharacterized protein n=1 Tax=Streptomyces hintoniae TaxID=3075521 RepID=A0ABU2UNJ9_9ACTN|nr:hypothetical protein [Streptomyces sp. DSM 41014]MDT0474795.1 hypothetical protein [Streptomyces sp. DSM 41014]
MITINEISSSVVKLTDHSAVASPRVLGTPNNGTGLSGIRAVLPVCALSVAGLPVRDRGERNERATEALEAVAAEAQAYAFTAAGAGGRKQTTHHHQMWAFRGPEPWSDPA